MSYSGQPLRCLEEPKLVSGDGSFVDDIRLPDMLYTCVLRSPHVHARIRSIDVAVTRLLLGVVAVITGGDIAGVLRDLPIRAMR
jgi:aerobic carbon-monoxide dehydrogenase large subunit